MTFPTPVPVGHSFTNSSYTRSSAELSPDTICPGKMTDYNTTATLISYAFGISRFCRLYTCSRCWACSSMYICYAVELLIRCLKAWQKSHYWHTMLISDAGSAIMPSFYIYTDTSRFVTTQRQNQKIRTKLERAKQNSPQPNVANTDQHSSASSGRRDNPKSPERPPTPPQSRQLGLTNSQESRTDSVCNTNSRFERYTSREVPQFMSGTENEQLVKRTSATPDQIEATDSLEHRSWGPS